jgi:hypothetical protein
MRAEVFGPLGLHVLTMRAKIEETGDRYGSSIDYRSNRARSIA